MHKNVQFGNRSAKCALADHNTPSLLFEVKQVANLGCLPGQKKEVGNMACGEPALTSKRITSKG